MFDLPAKLLSSVATFLFPVFASYKALKGNDPGQLAPWLMYWVVLACLLLVESWFEWILMWFPFYAWIRACVLLYLVLPQTQGARLLYQTYIDPFLTEHESEIDHFIASAHDRARDAGLQYLKSAIEYVRVHILGLQPRQSSQSSSQYASSAGSYTQNLLARFYLPSARTQQSGDAPAPPATSAASDIYNLISSVLGGGHARAGPASGEHPKPTSSSTGPQEERMNYITTQRERLRWLLQDLDKEAAVATASSSDISPGETSPTTAKPGTDPGSRAMRKNRSEPDFENVEREDVADEKTKNKNKPGTDGGGGGLGGWMPWNWSSGATNGSGNSNNTATATGATGTADKNADEKGSSSSSTGSSPASSPAGKGAEPEVGARGSRSTGTDI